LRAVEAFIVSGNKPEWMVMECIPVMPPDLRPMVQLEGGRFATSDLNDLYRRIVNRNNRLKRLLEIGAPNMIIRNEKRMLQEAVDVMIDNGRRGRPVTGTNGRPLKSLSDIIEGKQGRFRQNLLGKRVDYSGRSVIVVGPTLKLHQCGVPKEMALELFKPFIIRKLVEAGHVQNVKSAKKKIENKDVEVFDVLEEVINGHPVLLNRAPTLHRLGIQAFEPVLVEGKAIQLHPLVCTAFNADFDGDQMAIHVPLSLEAQAECRLLMLASNNILSPSNGNSIITPTQDMILGIYYLTIDNPDASKGKGKVFSNVAEAILAYHLDVIEVHAEIKVRKDGKFLTTTIGRILLNEAVGEVLTRFNKEPYPFFNQIVGKKDLSKLISKWHDIYGTSVAAAMSDHLKDLGYHYATRAGITVSIEDLQVPPEKQSILAKADKEVEKLRSLLASGSLTDREMIERSHEVWRGATEDISKAMLQNFGRLNNVYIMAHSGARGNIDQVRQLSGMRGLMADASGNTVDIPIKANFREGLSMTDYFISAYGARKGIVDTALRTADSGYLTRRLVDVAQDVMITMPDCGTKDTIEVRAIKEGYDTVMPLSDRLAGRILGETIVDITTQKEIAQIGVEISEELAKVIESTGIEAVKIRSVLTCRADKGICQKCYGRDLSRNKLINIGEAVGIISAQSIGEPGTQLTMRTFHTGGVDLRKASKIEIKAHFEGTVVIDENLKIKKITDDFDAERLIVVREGNLIIERSKELHRVYSLKAGAFLSVKNNQKVKLDDVLAEHDPSYEYVISGNTGLVRYLSLNVKERLDKDGKVIERVAKNDGEVFVYTMEGSQEYEAPEAAELYVQEGVRVKEEEDIANGVVSSIPGLVLSVKKAGGKNIITIVRGEAYPVLSGARLYVAENSKVETDDILCRESSQDMSKARDIVAGLPRVEELFEARKPKNLAILSEIDGNCEIKEKEGIRIITIAHGSSKESRREYKVPFGIRIKVFPGKHVQKGEILTEGIQSPHDLLMIRGVQVCNTYLSEEIQKVYRTQGVTINEKHIETIIRQMTRKVQITQMGDSKLLIGDLMDHMEFEKVNKELKKEGKVLAKAERVLLGITKASINTESMISAASFQETTSVLTIAAVKGKLDPMYGLKENVIIGKLIPVGTGLKEFRHVEIFSPEGLSLEPVAKEPELELIKDFEE
jgi:DNA-directed RNA polymerase subunit beta'